METEVAHSAFEGTRAQPAALWTLNGGSERWGEEE